MTIEADILNEDCSNLDNWDNYDVPNGVTEVDPAGKFKLDTNTYVDGSGIAYIETEAPELPDEFTVEILIYLDNIGTYADGDNVTLVYSSESHRFKAIFCSDGLYLRVESDSGLYSASIIKCNENAEYQTYRFQVSLSAGEVEIFLNNVYHGKFPLPA